jgi:hypothetical protein
MRNLQPLLIQHARYALLIQHARYAMRLAQLCHAISALEKRDS